MKVIQLRQKKEVQYMGETFTIPDNHTCMAVDSWGDLNSFIDKPKPIIDEGYWDNPTGEIFEFVATVDLEGLTWYESLRDV